MKCQNCSSDNTQTIKMTCLSGSTTGTSTAIGISSNLSVGVASIDSKTQTHLVSTLKPGPKPSKYGFYNCYMILIGILGGVILAINGISSLSSFNLINAVFGLGLGGTIFVAIYKFYKKPSEMVLAWNRKNKLYENGWMEERYMPQAAGVWDKVNVSEGSFGIRKQYVFTRIDGKGYVYTLNGRVTSWQSMD